MEFSEVKVYDVSVGVVGDTKPRTIMGNRSVPREQKGCCQWLSNGCSDFTKMVVSESPFMWIFHCLPCMFFHGMVLIPGMKGMVERMDDESLVQNIILRHESLICYNNFYELWIINLLEHNFYEFRYNPASIF